jgi:toluene monooxygenase system protein E
MTTGRPPARKSYSRLAGTRRIPTEYEVVSTDLHYNYPDGFELTNTPVVDWYRRHREGSKLCSTDWGSFADPRQTTYRAYTELQDRKEDVVDGLLRQVDHESYDDELSDAWVDFFDRWYAPLRFPAHGLQMLAAYVAQMAPASRITNCAAFQAADEMRRVQRVAYRTAQLADHRPTVDVGAHQRRWEEADAYQPLRELIERALIAYDWGEALVVTNVVIKPYFDRLVNVELAGELAARNNDPVLHHIHFSLDEDARWHRDWSRSLIRLAVSDTPENADVVSSWIDAWRPLAVQAIGSLAAVASTAPVTLEAEEIRKRIESSVSDEIASLIDVDQIGSQEQPTSGR